MFAGLLGAAVISWLLYRSWYAMFLAVPVGVLYRKQYREEKIRKRKERLLAEFKDGMQAVSGALLAGYSMENAWREAEKELCELYGDNSMMYREAHLINTAVKMSEPLESVLMEFAIRSGCEEIGSFAEVFSFAKRSGGNFPGIIQTTIRKLSGRMEVEREIGAVLSGKKLEGRIMNSMPVLILLYLNLTSGEFLDVLYGNVPGVLMMTLVLVVYGISLKLSSHILNIRV